MYSKKPSLFTGKSFYIRNYLMKLDMEYYTPGFITFTTATTASFTQELVLTKLVKRKRGKSLYKIH